MKKSIMTITPPYKNKALGLTASILALSSVLGSASIAKAATFNFSFTDDGSGGVAGTVTGTITLPDGDGTFAATGVTITSAPAGLNFSGFPIDVLANAVSVFENTFTVVGGAIQAAASQLIAPFNLGSGSTAFGLTDDINQSYLGINGNQVTVSGVRDVDSSSLTFTPVSASTPEPTSVITLIGVGVLGVASKLKKKA